jgi:hypothetical protein
MALGAHLELWRTGPSRLVSQSRYAALLVSLHGWRLYERRDLHELSPTAAREVRRFLAGHRAFQEELIAELRSDPRYASVSDHENIDRNSRLVWTWDLLSLALCLEDWRPATARHVPSFDGEVDIELRGAEGRFTLEPWPLREATVTVRCEGRRIAPVSDADAMQEQLSRAPWVTLEFVLAQAANDAAAIPAERSA